MVGLTAASPSTAPGGAIPRPVAKPERHTLTAMRDTMNLAHEKVLAARLPPSDPLRVRTARVEHLRAMSQYEQALTSCHLPIPSRLLQEARLLRRLLT